MSAELLDGERVAAGIKMQLAERVQRLVAIGTTPGLGTILVGDDPSSARYVEMKIEECAEIGIRSFDEHLSGDATQREIEEIVDRFNALAGMLEAGEIAGAGLDVFEHEPAVNPKLLKLPNVVLLPHMSSATIEGRVDMGEKVIVNIRTWMDGHKPPDRVIPSML